MPALALVAALGLAGAGCSGGAHGSQQPAATTASAPPSPSSPSPSGDAAPSDVMTLVLMGTTDTHGHVESEQAELTLEGGERVTVERGGLTLFGGYLENARLAHPGAVLLVDSGDMLQGTMVSNLGEGAAVVSAMNALGYAAAAVGNHEFDFGPEGERVVPGAAGDDPRGALKRRAGEARYAWLTSNVKDEKGQAIGEAVRDFVVVDVGGIKVGIVGGTSEDTPRTTNRLNLVGLKFSSLPQGIERAAAAARAAGATVIVATVHAGGECTRFDDPRDLSSCDGGAEVFRLARALPPGTVDAIFAGHTHQGLSHLVAGIPVAQSYAEARAFSRIDLHVDRKTGRPLAGAAGYTLHPPTEICAQVTDGVPSCDARRARGHHLLPASYEGRPVVADDKVVKAIAADVARASKKRSEPVGVVLETPMWRAYRAESPLGNFSADVLRAAGKTDLGLTNGGGLRGELPAGELSYGTLFQAFPFDNKLAVVTLSGSSLRRLVTRNMGSAKGILSLSGVAVRASCRGDALWVDFTFPGGKALDEAARYTVATSDFLALGGDDFGTLEPPLTDKDRALDDGVPPIRDLLAAELRRRGPRLRGDDKSFFDEAHRRVTLPASRPFKCPLPGQGGAADGKP